MSLSLRGMRAYALSHVCSLHLWSSTEVCECVGQCVVRVVCACDERAVVCEPCWVASAVAAVVSVRGRSISMRGSAVSTPVVVVSGDACACVQVLEPAVQPDQRQLSVCGVRAVFVDVRVLCAVCVCLCVGSGRCTCAVYGVHLPLCVGALHVW
jgi:hypothetical protein